MSQILMVVGAVNVWWTRQRLLYISLETESRGNSSQITEKSRSMKLNTALSVAGTILLSIAGESRKLSIDLIMFKLFDNDKSIEILLLMNTHTDTWNGNWCKHINYFSHDCKHFLIWSLMFKCLKLSLKWDADFELNCSKIHTFICLLYYCFTIASNISNYLIFEYIYIYINIS